MNHSIETPNDGLVEIDTYDDGRTVLWMSNWGAVGDLVKSGVLKYGPPLGDCYGHRDLTLAGGGHRA